MGQSAMLVRLACRRPWPGPAGGPSQSVPFVRLGFGGEKDQKDAGSASVPGSPSPDSTAPLAAGVQGHPGSGQSRDGERDPAPSRPNTGRSDSGAQRGADGADRTRSRKMRQPMTEIMAQIARLEVESRFDPTISDLESVIASTLLPQVISKVIASGPRLRVKLRMIGRRGPDA